MAILFHLHMILALGEAYCFSKAVIHAAVPLFALQLHHILALKSLLDIDFFYGFKETLLSD